MFSLQELRQAQKYPFSESARRIVKDSSLRIDDIPMPVVSRAKAMVAFAFSDRDYFTNIKSSTDLLMNEILAYPVAKIIVSIIDRYELYRKFSFMIEGSVAKNLASEKDDVLVDTAAELGVRISLSEESGWFAQLMLADYLRVEVEEQSMKLVNRSVSKGRVFLTRQEFVKFLASLVASDLRKSLQAKIDNPPRGLALAAKEIDAEFSAAIRKKFSKADFGEVKPEFFPPCMSKIYSELSSGINANHYARFAMAAYLSSVGMSAEKIIEVYSHTPNFNEKVTRYQVERIAGVKGNNYSCPSCDKMRSYNLCVSNCPVVNPVQFYSKEISRGKNVPQEKAQ